jgi:hypothetical protein
VPDEVCGHFRDLGDYDYLPAREVADADENTEVRSVVDVDILGHIFEQSITNLEHLRLSLEHPNVGQRVPPALPSADTLPGRAGGTHCPTLEPEAGDQSADETRARKRRKQEGAVYTPALITRYIVSQALGGVLKQRFEASRQQHETEAAGTARKALADPNAYDLTKLNEPQRKALIRFWEAWQDVLKHLRILDLACGSGAFLIETFDQLHALFEISNARLEELRGQRTLFDLDRQIWRVDPLRCPVCQSPMRVGAAIDDPRVVERILRHLGAWHDPPARRPPQGVRGPYTYESCDDVDPMPDYENVLTD